MADNKEIEIVQDAGQLSPDELSKRFYSLIKEFYGSLSGYGDEITDKQIIDNTKIATWRACMQYIHLRLLNNIDMYLPGCHGGKRLNVDIMDKLADVYIYYCNVYNKPPSVLVFSDLCDIDQATIEKWGGVENADELTLKRSRLHKKVSQSRKESIIGRVLDGGASTLGAVTMYNNEVLGGTIGAAENDVKQLSSIPRFQLPG